MDFNLSDIASIGQIPILAAFLWFAVRIYTEQAKERKELQELHREERKERMEQWARMIQVMQERHRSDMDNVLTRLVPVLEQTSANLTALQQEITTHTRTMEDTYGRMSENYINLSKIVEQISKSKGVTP